jgi:transcriptional regulator with XRE-family HTH domain
VTTQPVFWEDVMMARVAAEIRRLRAEQKMSAQAVSDATSRMGHTVTRTTISDIETGRRKYITVAELMLLARALNTSPVLLVFPPPYFGAPVEVLPNVTEAERIAAVDWFSGKGRLVGAEAYCDDIGAYLGNLRALDGARRIQELDIEIEVLEGRLRKAIGEDDQAGMAMFTHLLADISRRIEELENEARGG